MIIDTDDYAASGIEVFTFPGGEWHANVPAIPTTEQITVHAKLRTWDDVGKLLEVADALVSQYHYHMELFAPYFPGMRQDRNPNGLTPLTARVYAQVLANFFSTVTVVDPHSELGLSFLQDEFFGGVDVIYPEAFIADLIPVDKRPDVVVIPDKGASVRSQAVAAVFDAQTVQASKQRDFATGALSGFALPENRHLGGLATRILIPDDICDGGGTFLGLLAEIRKQTLAPVDLYVTHGIFSKGLQVLAGFDNVYTTDSFYQGDEAKTIQLLPYIDNPGDH